MFICVLKPDAPAFSPLTSCVPLSWQCVCVNLEFDFLWLIWLINGVTIALWDVQPCACISLRTYNPRASCCSISISCCASTSQMFQTWEKEFSAQAISRIMNSYPVNCIDTVSGFRSINGVFTLKCMPLPHNFIHSYLLQSVWVGKNSEFNNWLPCQFMSWNLNWKGSRMLIRIGLIGIRIFWYTIQRNLTKLDRTFISPTHVCDKT